MSEIEWEVLRDGTNLVGLVCSTPLFEVEGDMLIYGRSGTTWEGKSLYGVIACDNEEAAKSKAAELLAEWDKKRGMIPADQIYFCGECGDVGEVLDALNKPIPCPTCREKPYSIVSLRREK